MARRKKSASKKMVKVKALPKGKAQRTVQQSFAKTLSSLTLLALPSKGTVKTVVQEVIHSSYLPVFGFLLALTLVALLPSYIRNKANNEPTVLSTTATDDGTVWCDSCRVTTINIPSILFYDDAVAKMQFDVEKKTWPTPIAGIGTPKETIRNNVIVFGHSKWLGKVNHFSRISQIKPGDEITITDQFERPYVFVVTQLELLDRNQGSAVRAKESMQLTLLTSARYNSEWLLPSTVDPATKDNVQDKNTYTIFVVTAKPKL